MHWLRADRERITLLREMCRYAVFLADPRRHSGMARGS